MMKMIARSAELPARALTIEADGTYGFVLTGLQIGRTWTFDATSLLRMHVWNGSAVEILDHTAFTFAGP